MWLALSFLALSMLTLRRTAEKTVSNNISSMAMVWLQQAVALPFIFATIFFARFYLPNELSSTFWSLLIVYIITSSVDLFCYFKAISMADISYVAPLQTLFVAGNIIGAYIILGQIPSLTGAVGAFLIMGGAYLSSRAKSKQKIQHSANRLALILVLISVVLKSFYANIEVIMLRETNPVTYNFYTSVLTVLIVILVTWLVTKRNPQRFKNYWPNVKLGVKNHIWPLTFVGLTYTINILATYQAKLISPNAAYVGAIKSAAILPLVVLGVFLFKEKVTQQQWVGVGLILFGLIALSTN